MKHQEGKKISNGGSLTGDVKRLNICKRPIDLFILVTVSRSKSGLQRTVFEEKRHPGLLLFLFGRRHMELGVVRQERKKRKRKRAFTFKYMDERKQRGAGSRGRGTADRNRQGGLF